MSEPDTSKALTPSLSSRSKSAPLTKSLMMLPAATDALRAGSKSTSAKLAEAVA